MRRKEDVIVHEVGCGEMRCFEREMDVSREGVSMVEACDVWRVGVRMCVSYVVGVCGVEGCEEQGRRDCT